MKGRREFLKQVTAAASLPALGHAELSGRAAPERAREPEPPAEAPVISALAPVEYPRRFTGSHLARIAFPLGGVAAGSVSLGGRGQLRDWEIFNRPDKGRAPDYAFPCIWAQVGSAKPVARVLEARLAPPFDTAGGLSPAQVSGLSRLDDATFTGEYPLAKIEFHDRALPVQVSLEAFTPIIPHDADAAGLPVAVLRYIVHNRAKESAKVSIAWSLDNPAGVDLRGGTSREILDARSTEFRKSANVTGLMLTNPGVAKNTPLAGSLALCVLNSPDAQATYLRGWPRAKWWASPLLFWDDFSSDGQLGPEAPERNGVASLCLQREIAAGAKAEYTFLLAWHFPNRTPAWCGWSGEDKNAIIGNHYCQRFANAWDAAEHAAQNLPSLERRMRRFLDAVRETTIPSAIKDAAMANLSTLATQTCFRTADGKFRGFEGSNNTTGCCHGSCTHVWNYETTTQFLFPSLARSMRDAAFDLSGRLDGMLPIRLSLPEGKQTGGTTAADGTMGQIIKTHIDWQLSGDDSWLRQIWPRVKKAMEFTWIEGGWDADRDGVMEGVQHNTYDVEFYGPNPMCGVYYLGALRASEEMARAMGDGPFAAECRRLFEHGSKWIDANLFNGEYYVQKIQGIAANKIAKQLHSTGGAEDTEHPDFQLGEGCLTDQLMGQYLADVAGLGPLLDPEKIRKTLASIYKYNFRASLSTHDSVERIYALNDEAAVLLCGYREGTRPRIPFPYASEAWTGIEYPYGTQLMHAGMDREGARCFEDVRRRFDGERRNPWDEPECGHHYARAMSAWSGLVMMSGFQYRGPEQQVIAAPRIRPAAFSSFWSTGNAWGVFSQSQQSGRTRFSLSVLYGHLPCRSVQLAIQPPATAKSTARLGAAVMAHELRKDGRRVNFTFRDPLQMKEGDRLAIET